MWAPGAASIYISHPARILATISSLPSNIFPTLQQSVAASRYPPAKGDVFGARQASTSIVNPSLGGISLPAVHQKDKGIGHISNPLRLPSRPTRTLLPDTASQKMVRAKPFPTRFLSLTSRARKQTELGLAPAPPPQLIIVYKHDGYPAGAITEPELHLFCNCNC